MPSRDPSKVQLDFPLLVADIINDLSLLGTVGLLDFLDAVRPVYIVAAREGALTVTATPPTFSSADVFAGRVQNPAANAVIADTGPLPAGVYDLQASLSVIGGNVAAVTYDLQHRDAANTSTLATLLQFFFDGGARLFVKSTLPLIGYTIGLNERIRAQNSTNVGFGGYMAEIFATIRSTP